MRSKILKRGISGILALLLIFTPAPLVRATMPIVVQGLESTPAAAQEVANEKYSSIEDLAQKKGKILNSLYNVTSIQYALIDKGEIVLSGQVGHAKKEGKISPTNETMYNIGSISKMFVTVSIMQLVEDGKVNLDTPVVEYVPEFTMADERYKNITVRMLLNHSSGLMGSCYGNALLLNDKDTLAHDIFLDNLKKQRLKADPGAFSVYCNDGFTLGEIIIERVSKMAFNQYIKQNIVEPLGLKNTVTPLDTFDAKRMAKAYAEGFKGALPQEYLGMIGAGGIISTAEDLCEFSQIFMGKRLDILQKKSVDLMRNEEYLHGIWKKAEDTVLNYGLGWDGIDTYPFNLYQLKALTKGGDTIFNHGMLVTLPDQDMAVAVLSSGGSSSLNMLLGQEILLEALREKGIVGKEVESPLAEKPIKAPVPDSMKKYEGFYANSSGVDKISIDEEGTLSMEGMKLTYTNKGTFVDDSGNVTVNFVTEKNGKTYLWLQQYQDLSGVGKTAMGIYVLQKVDDNPISQKVTKAWKQRSNKKYLLLNEKYSSIFYIDSLPCIQNQLSEKLTGYYNSATIVDENNAQTRLEIPMVIGRDLRDYHFYKKGNKEYLESSDGIYISEDTVKNLTTKPKFKVKIGNDGYAKWFRVPAKLSGKKIAVKVGKNATFAVYKEDRTFVSNYYVDKKGTITLPKDGYLVFAGNKGVSFTVTNKK